MNAPNYQYCALWCAGVIKDCPNYERSGLFRVCKTYKLIEAAAPDHKFNLTKESLEKIVKLAGEQ